MQRIPTPKHSTGYNLRALLLPSRNKHDDITSKFNNSKCQCITILTFFRMLFITQAYNKASE